MAGVQQDILVKIKVLLEGLGNVRALAGHVKDLSGGGGQVVALAGNIDKLSAAVDKLASASEKTSKSGGFVRFLVGVSAVVSTLGNIPQAFQGISKLLDVAEAVKGKAGPALEKVSGLFTRAGTAAQGAVSSVSSSLSELAGGAGAQAGAVLSRIGGSLAALGPIAVAVVAALVVVVATVAALAAGFVSLGAGVAVGSVALVAIARQGLQAHRQLEQVQLGIAAIITSLSQVKVAGLPVEGAEKFAAATKIAADQVAKLRVDAINTTATFEQIAPAYQAALAPGLAAGLSLDQVREITVKVVQAAGALGIPFEQVNQEVRAILEGTINEDARLAKVLGISNKMVASWKSQGKLAEELNKRLAGFALAGEETANTFDGLTSNLQEALNVFSAEATTRAFDALKGEFKRLIPQLFDFKAAGIQAQFKSLTDLADDMLLRVVRIAGSIAQDIVAGVKRVGEFVAENRALIDAILNLCVGVVKQLIDIARVIAGVASDAAVWKTTLDTVHVALLLVNGVLALIVEKLREAAPLLRLLILAANIVAQGSLGLGGVGVGGGQPGPQGDLAGGTGEFAATVTSGRTGGGKTGGGGGGRKSRVPELTRALGRATVETELARAQARFEELRQEIAATVDAVKDGLDDTILSISNAYRLEALLADKALKNEQDRIDAELTAAQKRHDLAIKDLDPTLKAEERGLAISAEDEKLAAEIVKLESERKRLIEETKDKKSALVRAEARDQQALEDAVADIENQLDAMSRSGAVRADAAAREIETRFRETRKQMVANFGEASEQVKKLDALIRGLSERAKFEELTADISEQFSILHDAEELLNIGVEQGSIKAEDALKRRLELERELKRTLIDQIEGLTEIYNRTGDPRIAAAIRQLQIEYAKLGHVINETAKSIDDTLRGGLEDTLVDIITRTKTVGEAFRSLAQTILAEIARILAAKFVEKLFGGLLNTGGGNSIGNILAGILGAGTPRTSGTPQPAGSGIENIPLIIKNFQSGTGNHLQGIKGNTAGAIDELRGGFAIVSQGFNELLSFLPNLLPATPSLLSNVLSAAVGAVAGSFGVNLGVRVGGGVGNEGPSQPRPTKPPVLKRALGDMVRAVAGGRLVQVAEGGYDELIVTTDPKHKGRTAGLLAQFIRRTGILPNLDWESLFANMGRVPVPAFEAGGFALDAVLHSVPEATSASALGNAGDSMPSVKVYIQTPNPQAFKQNEHLVERTISRAVHRARGRSIASNK